MFSLRDFHRAPLTRLVASGLIPPLILVALPVPSEVSYTSSPTQAPPTVGSFRSLTALAVTKDPVGNREVQTTTGLGAGVVNYTYDDRDRLLTENGTLYGWDDNGNLTSKSAEATYFWDFEDRLVRVEKTDGAVVTHAYDADGNRVRTEVTPSTGPPTVTEFLVDPSGSLSRIIAETDHTGNLIAQYVRGVDDLLSVIRPTETRFYHADGLGSIRFLTDESGNVTDSYEYTAFGEQLQHVGTDPQPYQFAGGPFEPNSRVHYNRTRWLDSSVGRFLSADTFRGPESVIHLAFTSICMSTRTRSITLTQLVKASLRARWPLSISELRSLQYPSRD